MQSPRASWLLAACIWNIISATNTSVLEVDLIFPRNSTYAPTNDFPVVFAFQNAQRARYLNPSIQYLMWNLQTDHTSFTLSHDLGWKIWTEETYLAHEVMSFPSEEGHYKVSWSMTWDSCDEESFENPDRIPRMDHNKTTWATYFSIDNSAPQVDLVAATANEMCTNEYGMIINVSDKTLKVPSSVEWSAKAWNNNTCAVMANSTSTSTPDPCRVHIDKAAAESIHASVTARVCSGIDPPEYCEKNAATQLAVAGVSCLLAAVGALGFFLA
ncbi:uncharacterized protein N7503_009075 [Penicillium pulvis]|uniref:uncharacterized protein n=1 Tax=Penicillium pulvis TaxID=1562058 RepID=UPI002546ABF6|nr:uncharacterized protein N7503_009075 [Penicillium pulvis]KAJ5793097.1 hypothetical protein N7503_009075 [Penicillium pulvis]